MNEGIVVGTAGHIDHGKTSLVKALTGLDLDTLPEEKARGITVALGFAPLVLADGRKVSFVDVPGHERLVRTMIAGATGIDAAVLCVSAVDGAMPQTREHVAILDLLGVRTGVIAVTMADLVDDELLALAVDDIRGTVAGTFLAAAPIVPVSSVTRRGIDALVEVIAGFGVPDRSSGAGAPFRLPIDRVFVRAGFGVVVTGTAWSGVLTDGDQVELIPDGGGARVRGIEVHGSHVTEAVPGWRTALNLSGVEPEKVHRGLVVTRGAVPLAPMIDVRYRHLAGGEPIEEGASVNVLHGTTERQAKIHRAEPAAPDRDDNHDNHDAIDDDGALAEVIEPGTELWVQLRLEAPLPCLPGDRVVVRRPSPATTLGGGVIVDPWTRRVRRRDRAAHAAGLDRLAAGDRAVWLERAADAGLSARDCAERGIDAALGVTLGDRILAPAVVDQLSAVLTDAIAAHHREHPLAPGAPRRDLRRGRLGHLADKPFDALLEVAAARGRAVLDGPVVRAPGFAVTLDAGQQQVRAALLASLAEAGLEGRSVKEIAQIHADAIPIAHLLEADGTLSQVAGLGWVVTGLLDEMAGKIRAWFADHPELSPQDFKELTGLSRKSAIPLLEWLDRQRVTRRDGDKRLPVAAG